MARQKRQSIHYVNNAEFSQAVVDYVTTVQEAKKTQTQLPIVPDYIASCFLRIAEGLSHKSNFIRYTYREEMVMDAVENCLKAVENYNLEAATRTGKPNAFAYFTQITWYAFLRRIAKEKKQQDIKFRWIEKAGVDDFLSYGDADTGGTPGGTERAFVEELRGRIDKIREVDNSLKEFGKKEKAEEKERKAKGLELFMGA